jgi:Tol biopolymer transport system component
VSASGTVQPLAKWCAVATAFATALIAGCWGDPRQASGPSLPIVRPGAFSHDNTQLFVDYCDAERCDIGALSVATGALTLYTPRDRSYELHSPSLSYDGTHLAVSIKKKRETSTAQLAIVDLNQGRYRIVTSSPTLKEFPSFSPNGRKIIFSQANRERPSGATRFSRWDVYEVDIPTSEERRLTDFCFFLIGTPQYYPDGKSFLFSGDPPMCNYPARGAAVQSYKEYAQRYQQNTIFRMTEGQTTLKPLFERGPHSNGPILSQDGRRVLFVSRTNDLDGRAGNYNYDLFMYEGGATRRLTDLQTMITGTAASRDVQLIAYQSDQTRNRKEQLWLFDLKTGIHSTVPLNPGMIQRVEIDEAGHDTQTKWSPAWPIGRAD